MPKPIVFGLYVFTTMKECSINSRERIIKYKTGETLNADDFDYFSQLFTLHPDYNKKRGVGIKAIKYDLDGLSVNNSCLWVVRHDGSEENISWRKCIRPHTHDEEVEIAFKRAVSSNISIGAERNAIANSSIKFNQLLKRFLYRKKIRHQHISISQPPENGDPRPLLVDHWLAAEWFVFHEENMKASL